MLGFWIQVSLGLALVVLFALGLEAFFGDWVESRWGRQAHLLMVVAGFGAPLLAWVSFQLWHVHLLARWVRDFRVRDAPAGAGIWHQLFQAIFRLVKAYDRQRLQLQSTIESFRRATEAMPDGVITLDDHLQITYMNRQGQAHLGLRSPDDIGRSILHLVRNPDFAEFLERTTGQPLQLTDVPRPGRVLQLQQVVYGEQERMLMTRDITQLIQMERSRRDFVANVSHELKTPLTVISGFLETMRDLPLSEAQRAQAIEAMSGQASRMRDLIQDLLVLARLESEGNGPTSADIEMDILIERLLTDAGLLSRGRHEIRWRPSGWRANLAGDESELASAIGNLLTNAVRYTPEGGQIELWWEPDEAGGGACLTVSDTGPGIPPEHLNRLTERFYRIDTGRSRDSGGTGLGLAIVKHVAQRHDARLVIESQLGEGSQFCLVFPPERVRPR